MIYTIILQRFKGWKVDLIYFWLSQVAFPATTRHWNNAGLILAHHQQHWTNVKPALGQHVAGFALQRRGDNTIINTENTLRWHNVSFVLGQRRRRWPNKKANDVSAYREAKTNNSIEIGNIFYCIILNKSTSCARHNSIIYKVNRKSNIRYGNKQTNLWQNLKLNNYDKKTCSH